MTAVTEQKQVNYYEQLGGAAGIRQLVNDFYDDMEQAGDATELRRMHAADLSAMRQTLFEFLSGWLGGPRVYWERTNAKCMMSAHAGMPISSLEAEQWLRCMRRALDKLPADSAACDFIHHAFTKVCQAMINRPSVESNVESSVEATPQA